MQGPMKVKFRINTGMAVFVFFAVVILEMQI